MLNYKYLDRFLESDGRYVIKKDGLLSECCTFKIGGAADYIIYPRSAESLTALAGFLYESGLKYSVFGNGSNVLFPDGGYGGVIIFTRGINEISAAGDTLTVGSGASLTAAVSAAYKAGLGGMEFAYGIPGSCGGAVYMNAGAFGGQMSDIVDSGVCYDPRSRETRPLDARGHDFSYRHSVFTDSPLIILSTSLKLVRSEAGEIKARMDKNMRHRVEHQPLDYPSAGSVFKRCPGHFTSKLIEDAGLKGARVGGAQVSPKHAGFIINTGGATARDVLGLIDIIKETVFKKFGAHIECEIKIVN